MFASQRQRSIVSTTASLLTAPMLVVIATLAACGGDPATDAGATTVASATTPTTSSTSPPAPSSTADALSPSTTDDDLRAPASTTEPELDDPPPPMDFTLDDFVERWNAGVGDNANRVLTVGTISTPPPAEQFNAGWTETLLLGTTPLGQLGVAALADSELVIDVNCLLPIPTSNEEAETGFNGFLYAMTVVDPLLTVDDAIALFEESGIGDQGASDGFAAEVEANGILHCFALTRERGILGYRSGSAMIDTICSDDS